MSTAAARAAFYLQDVEQKSSRNNWILNSIRKDVAQGQDLSEIIEFWLFVLNLATHRTTIYATQEQARKVLPRIQNLVRLAKEQTP